MDWKEALSKLKFKLAEVNAEGKQVGVINVNIENKTINYNFPSTGTVFVAGEPSPDSEKKVKEEVERRLINLGVSPDLLSGIAVTEIVSATTATTVMDVMVKGAEKIGLSENVIVKLSPESKPKK